MRRLPLLLLFSLLALGSCQEEAPIGPGAGVSAAASPLAGLVEAGDIDGIVALLEPRRLSGELSEEESQILAEARVAQNELPKAIKILEQRLEQAPDSLGHSMLLARLYTSVGLAPKALAVLQAAQAAGGSGPELALELALAHGRAGDLTRARDLLIEARKKGSDHDDIDYNLSLIYMEHRQYEEAHQLLSDLHERIPGRMPVRRELARAMFVRDPDSIEGIRVHCNAVLEADPEDWRAWEILGDAELHAGDHLAAQTYFLKALEFGAKEVGSNPPRVEEKYVIAGLAVREEMQAQGLIPEEEPRGRKAPPMPAGAEERIREARRKALEDGKKAAEEAEKAGQDPSPEQEDGH